MTPDFSVLGWAVFWGLVGQLIRFALGLRKWAMDPGRHDAFNWRLGAVSFLFGGVGGALASLLPGASPLAVIFAGYVGADGIEGMAQRYIPTGGSNSLTAILGGALLAGLLLLSSDPAHAQEPTCHRADSLLADLFVGRDVRVAIFEGKEAAALESAIAHFQRRAPAPVSEMRFVVGRPDYARFFIYGPTGCFARWAGGAGAVPDAVAAFAFADVPLPLFLLLLLGPAAGQPI